MMGNGIAHLARLGLSAVLAVLLPLSAMAKDVGTTVVARGVVTGQLEGRARLLGPGAAVREGEVVTTGRRSFAVLEFSDGTRMTLRPNSTFAVEEMSHGPGRRESFLGRLFKGGLRAVTGLVTLRNPDGFKVRTPVATIGIRGTDFSARLCAADCAQETGAQGTGARARGAKAARPVAGRVAFLKGEVKAQSSVGRTRRLAVGGAVYEGDLLETGPSSFAVVAFRDESRITMQAETRFEVAAHRFDRKKPDEGRVVIRLFNGVIRAVTGLVGSRRPESYRVETPVATLLVRGTRFDVICQGQCGRSGEASLVPGKRWLTLARLVLNGLVPAAHAQEGLNGLFVVTRQGSLGARLPDGREFDLRRDAFFSGPIPPRFDVPVPRSVLDRLPPAPENVDVPPNLLGSRAVPPGDPGLHVRVNGETGHASIESTTGEVIDIAGGEHAFANAAGEASRADPANQTFLPADRFLVNPVEASAEEGRVVGQSDPALELGCGVK